MLSKAMSHGVTSQPCGLMDIEFFHEMLPMLLDSLHAYTQLRGNLLVTESFSDELKEFRFTRT